MKLFAIFLIFFFYILNINGQKDKDSLDLMIDLYKQDKISSSNMDSVCEVVIRKKISLEKIAKIRFEGITLPLTDSSKVLYRVYREDETQTAPLRNGFYWIAIDSYPLKENIN